MYLLRCSPFRGPTMIMVLGLIAGNSVRGVEEEPIKDYQKSVPIEYPEDMEQDLHKMSFKPPQLTEEEERSPHMPDSLRCDSCIAVAFQLHEGFSKAHKGRRQEYRIKEEDVLDIKDEVCRAGAFMGYGLHEKDGENRLKGPGVNDDAGISHMGGKTPYRIAEMCNMFMGEEDQEWKLYQHWVTHGQMFDALRRHMCFNEKLFPGYCNKKSSTKKKANKKDEL